MQLTKGGWMRMEASSSASAIVDGGEVVRPSQLITSVRQTTWNREERDAQANGGRPIEQLLTASAAIPFGTAQGSYVVGRCS